MPLWLAVAALAGCGDDANDSPMDVKLAMDSLGRLLDATPPEGRIPGANQPIAALVRDMFVEVGVTDVVIEEFAIPVSASTNHSFQVTSPASLAGPRAHQVNSFGGDGVISNGAVIDAGRASTPEPAAAGKVAMFSFAISRSLRTQYKNMVESGAIAAVIDSGIEELRNRNVWLLAGADSIDGPIPIMTIKQADAQALREQLELGVDVRIDMATDAAVTTKTGYNVIARIPGTTYPERTLLINGHLDSWFVGAGNDGQAVAALITLAKVLVANPLPYTVELVAFDVQQTHHLGSNNYMRRRMPQVRDTLVGAITLEMLAPKNPLVSIIVIDPMDAWLDAAKKTGLTTIFNVILTPVDQMTGFSGEIPSDQGNFWQFGVPGLYIVQTYQEYLSPLDNAENIDEAKYEQVLGGLEKTLRELGKLPPDVLGVRPTQALDVAPAITSRDAARVTGTVRAVNSNTQVAVEDAVTKVTLFNNDYSIVLGSTIATFVAGTGYTFSIDHAFTPGTPYVLAFEVKRMNQHTGRALLTLE